MNYSPRKSNELLLKRALLFDAAAERAEIRRLRALDQGNVREAEGAKISIADARDSARRLRAQVVKA